MKKEDNADAECIVRDKESTAKQHLEHLLKIGWTLRSSPVKALLTKYPELKR